MGGVFYANGNWFALGGKQKTEPRLLTTGSKIICLSAADDWLNENETEETAFKTRQWLSEPPTAKQVASLPPESRLDFNLTRYRASARITFEANKFDIGNLVLKAEQ